MTGFLSFFVVFLIIFLRLSILESLFTTSNRIITVLIAVFVNRKCILLRYHYVYEHIACLIYLLTSRNIEGMSFPREKHQSIRVVAMSAAYSVSVPPGRG